MLDLRRIYHRKEERIRAHITLCFLSWCWSGSPRPPPATPGHSSAKGWSACIWASPPAAPAHHPAHRDHPPPAGAARLGDQRTAAGARRAGPSGRAADGASVRVGTTRHPAWSHQACSQASSADPFTNNCRTRSNICAACVAGYHHPNDDGLVLSPRRGVERCQCECRTR